MHTLQYKQSINESVATRMAERICAVRNAKNWKCEPTTNGAKGDVREYILVDAKSRRARSFGKRFDKVFRTKINDIYVSSVFRCIPMPPYPE